MKFATLYLFSWSNGTVALNRMSVDLAGDKVVMIVGSVGSGKVRRS